MSSSLPSWDRTHDWVVKRFFNERARVTIRFCEPSPSIQELIAVRRLLPEYAEIPPGDLRARIGDTGVLALGVMPTRWARPTVERAAKLGLRVEATNASFISYIPFDRTTGCGWVIEDDSVAKAVGEAMIAAGVPVEDVEA